MKIINTEYEIEKKLPQIKEAFVEFYGEEYRRFIEERINNTFIITHISKQQYEEQKRELRRIYRMIEYENICDFLKELNIQNIQSYEIILRQWINDEINTEILKNIFKDHLKNIYPNINNEELSVKEKREIEKYLRKIKAKFKKTKRSIKKEKEKYIEIELMQKYTENLINKLDEKYLKICLEQIEKKLSKNEYNEIKNELSNCKNYTEIIDLCDKKISEKKHKYLKTLKKILNSAEKIEYNEALTGINSKNKIENMNFLEKSFANIYRLIENNSITVPNFIETNEKIILYSIVIYDLNNYSHYTDSTIIHELNHCIERNIIDENDKEIIIKCGWSRINYSKQNNKILKLNKRKSKKEKYNSVIFTEIINELITQDIMKIMHENNIFIINTKENSKIENGTLYEKISFIAKPFYEKYKNIIVESRINNTNNLKDTLGEKNLVELNNLINDAYKQKNIYISENSQYYKNKLNEILTNMENHKKQTKVKKI